MLLLRELRQVRREAEEERASLEILSTADWGRRVKAIDRLRI